MLKIFLLICSVILSINCTSINSSTDNKKSKINLSEIESKAKIDGDLLLKENLKNIFDHGRKKRKVFNDIYTPSRDVGIFSIDDNYLMNFDGKKYNPLSNEGLKIQQDISNADWNYNNDIDDTNDDGFWYNRVVHPYYEYVVNPPKHLNNVYKSDDMMINSGEVMKKRFRSTVDNNNNFNIGGNRRSFYFQ